jgi:outer membrane murein-binding lipoprotein Lpp
MAQALQAAVQKIHAYVSSLEEKMDAMAKKKS